MRIVLIRTYGIGFARYLFLINDWRSYAARSRGEIKAGPTAGDRWRSRSLVYSSDLYPIGSIQYLARYTYPK